MADQCLFDFLHMEIVSHVYKQQPNNGEVDNKVRIILLCMNIVQSFYETSVRNTSKPVIGTVAMRDDDIAYC